MGTVAGLGVPCDLEENDDLVSNVDEGGIVVDALDGKTHSDIIIKGFVGEKATISVQIESSLCGTSGNSAEKFNCRRWLWRSDKEVKLPRFDSCCGIDFSPRLAQSMTSSIS